MSLLARAVVAALIFAPAIAADEAGDKELKRLQGDWQIVAMTVDGETTTGAKLKGKVVRFDGTKMIPLDNKNEVVSVTIDPTQTPGGLDTKDKLGRVVGGIYKFTGDDKLTICAQCTGKRPKEFDASKGSCMMLLELERVKKKK